MHMLALDIVSGVMLYLFFHLSCGFVYSILDDDIETTIKKKHVRLFQLLLLVVMFCVIIFCMQTSANFYHGVA